MQKLSLPESITLSDKSTQFLPECCFDNPSISDMDYFINTLSTIKLKGVRPDLIGSIITHYASKLLPHDLAENGPERPVISSKDSPISATASWMKKKFFIETLVTILPPEKDSIPCNFLLRLLRVANTVGVDVAYRDELEKRVSRQLDEASLGELMIPSFSHTCGTLLDVNLVFRMVKKCVNSEEVAKGGAKLTKVAKLVDCYLAEAAVDSHMTLDEFVALGSVLPSHSRSTDDGLYRAIDIYLKAHPGLSKQERKTLWNLIDTRKLSPEASHHAAQNERLPVRAVIQVLLSEQTKLNKHIDWSGSLSSMRSPGTGFDGQARSVSKREINIHQMEIKRLKEDVLRLQSQCMNMERQIEKLLEKKKGYNFSWKKLGILGFKADKIGEIEGESEAGFGLKTPMEMKARLVRGRTSKKWRESLS
ncbi:hypothetical protein BUALT_Bualt07G0135000 [Buddleja alternifolia]|uniref:NPH3 domain-containing protein n=1 Tax=Buddleja alternifolia TaxID=168488 RepID=A0AAV6XIM8_9LAMI|nr:hypothetical protein BUALT_Bualt07G0135000 [Buddleja alternifolia]